MSDKPTASRAGLFPRLYLFFRSLCLLGSVGGVALVVSALVGGYVATWWARLGLGLLIATALPALLRWLAWRQLRRRVARPRRLVSFRWSLVGFNLLLLLVLCLGFANDSGRALRRRGDWFLGESQAPISRWLRRGIAGAALAMERFELPEDLPAEARALLAPMKRIEDDPRRVTEPAPPPPAPEWFHPVAGPRRRMPPNASCRFGARRPGRRPAECELGHCGVDLAGPVGTPIFAVRDGVVLTAQRDELRGGRAGRYIKLGHASDGDDKAVVAKTYYVHLDQLRAGLRKGSRVRGGELIGTIGLTGVKRSAPHLHFGLAVRIGPGNRFRYIDPEPLLRRWRLPSPPTKADLVAARR